MKSKMSRHIHWLFYGLFILGCARQTAPTGGPKDTIPPILLNAVPTHEQIHYTATDVTLTFNETIILNNPKEEILIIPDVGKDYDITSKKNKVDITFKTPLQENTTYSINFREAVQDITEKNPAEDLKLAFSTGNYIDSLSITGNVYYLLTSKAPKDATVALYQSDTFDIFKHRPSYFSKTDPKGNFTIEHLKPGDYYIYAMDDKNKNLFIDSKSEPYGFLSTSIHLDKDTANITIPLISLDTRPLKLTSARPSNTYYSIKTSKSLANYTLTATSDYPIISCFTPDQANILLYNTFPEQDSLLVHLIAEDSINNRIDTTLYAKFSTQKPTAETYKLAQKDFKLIGPKGLLTGQVNTNKPLLAIQYDSIFYRIDSTTVLPITKEDLSIDSVTNTIIIHKSFDPKILIPPSPPAPLPDQNPPTRKREQVLKPATPKKPQDQDHQIVIGPKTFISIESDTSKLITFNLKPTTLENTGIISVQVKTSETHYIVQLLSTDYTVLSSSINTGLTNFEDLQPKDYQIRLIIDTNKDGKWTPGNFFTHQQPESIVFYRNEKEKTTVTLKANWEIGPLLITH